MTKGRLLATASAAVLAFGFASAASADPNNFANNGSASVVISNASVGGIGGSGGAGGSPTGGATGGDGGAGGAGGVGGAISNSVNANSFNTYTSAEYNVTATNGQSAYTGGSIDTSGGTNKQYGGDASGSASSGNYGLNVNATDASGGDAGGGSAAAGNLDAAVAIGGTVLGTGDASAHATSGSGAQTADATSGDTTGGSGGSPTSSNSTTSGDATASPVGGDTNGTQTANGGAVGSGDLNITGLNNAAGAFAMNFSTGQFAAGNAANAIAAHVGTISTGCGCAE